MGHKRIMSSREINCFVRNVTFWEKKLKLVIDYAHNPNEVQGRLLPLIFFSEMKVFAQFLMYRCVIFYLFFNNWKWRPSLVIVKVFVRLLMLGYICFFCAFILRGNRPFQRRCCAPYLLNWKTPPRKDTVVLIRTGFFLSQRHDATSSH